MVLMMAGKMIFGLFFMHDLYGGHGDHGDGKGHEQMQHSDSDHRQMHQHDGAQDKDSVPSEDEK
jgi:hypothetical protein